MDEREAQREAERILRSANHRRKMRRAAERAEKERDSRRNRSARPRDCKDCHRFAIFKTPCPPENCFFANNPEPEEGTP